MNLKNKLIAVIVSVLFVQATNAQEIANCKNPSGYAYYHQAGIVSQKSSGWQESKITGGIFTLKRLPNNEYDILIVDARKSIISLTQDGGKIIPLRKGERDATFVHIHPGMVIEIYTFWTGADGKNRFDMLQSKGGDGMPIHLSSLMTGDCGTINFNLIN